MEDEASTGGNGNFAEDSGQALNDEAALRRFRIRLQHMLQKQDRASKPSTLKVRISDSELVEKAISRGWERLAEFRGNTPEEFLAWMFQILDDVIDEAHRFS